MAQDMWHSPSITSPLKNQRKIGDRYESSIFSKNWLRTQPLISLLSGNFYARWHCGSVEAYHQRALSSNHVLGLDDVAFTQAMRGEPAAPRLLKPAAHQVEPPFLWFSAEAGENPLNVMPSVILFFTLYASHFTLHVIREHHWRTFPSARSADNTS
ncbi:MAG: hypothetical protein OEY86_08485 [Nitrospira sp.]|nr:hypothetical protein [Nitrospira sp.]